MFLFWDIHTDSPEILGEDGEFYSYWEDNVSIKDNSPGKYQRGWMHTDKVNNMHPLNETTRFEFMCPKTGEWMNFHKYEDFSVIRQIQKLAGVKDWRSVV